MVSTSKKNVKSSNFIHEDQTKTMNLERRSSMHKYDNWGRRGESTKIRHGLGDRGEIKKAKKDDIWGREKEILGQLKSTRFGGLMRGEKKNSGIGGQFGNIK